MIVQIRMAYITPFRYVSAFLIYYHEPLAAGIFVLIYMFNIFIIDMMNTDRFRYWYIIN